MDLVGPGWLWNQITTRVLETALEAEMAKHLGYDKRAYAGRDGWDPDTGQKTALIDDSVGRRTFQGVAYYGRNGKLTAYHFAKSTAMGGHGISAEQSWATRL